MLNKKVLSIAFTLFLSALTSTANAGFNDEREETRPKTRAVSTKLWDGVTFTGRAVRFFTGEALKVPGYVVDEACSIAERTIPALSLVLGTSAYVLGKIDLEAFKTPESKEFLAKLFLRGTTNFAAQNLGFQEDFAEQYLRIPRSDNPIQKLAEFGSEKLHLIAMTHYWHKSVFNFDWETTLHAITPQTIAQAGTIIVLCGEILPKERTTEAYLRSAFTLAGTCLGAGLLGTAGAIWGGGLPGAVIGLGAAKITYDGMSWLHKTYKAYQNGFHG